MNGVPGTTTAHGGLTWSRACPSQRSPVYCVIWTASWLRIAVMSTLTTPWRLLLLAGPQPAGRRVGHPVSRVLAGVRAAAAMPAAAVGEADRALTDLGHAAGPALADLPDVRVGVLIDGHDGCADPDVHRVIGLGHGHGIARHRSVGQRLAAAPAGCGQLVARRAHFPAPLPAGLAGAFAGAFALPLPPNGGACLPPNGLPAPWALAGPPVVPVVPLAAGPVLPAVPGLAGAFPLGLAGGLAGGMAPPVVTGVLPRSSSLSARRPGSATGSPPGHSGARSRRRSSLALPLQPPRLLGRAVAGQCPAPADHPVVGGQRRVVAAAELYPVDQAG